MERNTAGLRKLPGTALKDGAGNTVYTPPQEPDVIIDLMRDLERFFTDDRIFDADPLIKMALIHHQFESIHPFYDGNGRTGRIINVLYLVKQGLLDIPVLYRRRHIVRTKADYYRLLQQVRESDAWEEWVLYILGAVERTAGDTVNTIVAIRSALMDYKHRIRNQYKFYSQDLINNLFTHPYTKIASSSNATSRFRALPPPNISKHWPNRVSCRKQKIGRTNYYVNVVLNRILIGAETGAGNVPESRQTAQHVSERGVWNARLD